MNKKLLMFILVGFVIMFSIGIIMILSRKPKQMGKSRSFRGTP